MIQKIAQTAVLFGTVEESDTSAVGVVVGYARPLRKTREAEAHIGR